MPYLKYECMEFLRGYKPLCFLENGCLLLYKRFCFYTIDMLTREIILVGKLNISRYKRCLAHVRLLERLLRLQPKSCIPINDEYVVIAFLKKLYLLNLRTGEITILFICRTGFSDVINFCKYTENGEWCVLFGDYGANSKKENVNIYKISSDLHVKKFYTFAAGKIRHIHNIIFSPCHEKFYILTGDNEPTAGIYQANKFFSEVKPLLIGKQNYRSVIAFPIEKGLLYATDSVMEQNYIYILHFEEERIITTQLAKLNGSCIYGVQNRNGYCFSTTVESVEMSKNKLRSLFTNRLGTGILSKDVDIVFVSKDLKISKLTSFQKDIFPMKLFQYGCVTFPVDMTDQSDIYCYPVGVKKFDNMILCLRN